MTLKLACADFTFPLLDHENVLRLVSMLEFEGVDIGLFEERSHLWPSREFANIGKSAGELKQKLDDLGLKPAISFCRWLLIFCLMPRTTRTLQGGKRPEAGFSERWNTHRFAAAIM